MVALSRNVGRKAAMEMLLLGDLIPAARAVEIGLVNRVVEPAALDGAVTELATAIAAKSPLTLKIGKEAFYRSEEHTSELQSLMRISYAVFCLKKKKKAKNT